MTEVVQRFASSVERVELLRGLLRYRDALAGIGITAGFQWLGGSFVEDCEGVRRRPPADIDVVTFAYRPVNAAANPDWPALTLANLPLFDPSLTKARFMCDAYYIDLQKPPHLAVEDTAYFNGLFSHQRDTALWKGMIRINLQSDDATARQLI